jgi:hypothetical protein
LSLAAVNVNEVKNEEQFMNVTPTPAITNTFLLGPRKSLHFKKYFLKIVSLVKSHCF